MPKGAIWAAWREEIEEKVRGLSWDDREYYPEFLGEYAARQASTRKLYALSALAVVGIVLLLYVDFQAWRPTLIVAFTMPFALIGGVMAVVLSGGKLSLGSLVGFVTVLGIAARNGIMMVSHFRHLELEEGEPFGIAAGAARRRGAARAHLDDGAGDRLGAHSTGSRRQQARARDRIPAGSRDRGRARDLDGC